MNYLPNAIPATFNKVLLDVLAERDSQEKLHVQQTPFHLTEGSDRYLIIAEEFGEVATAIMDGDEDGEYYEMVQTIACLVAACEGMLDRSGVK